MIYNIEDKRVLKVLEDKHIIITDIERRKNIEEITMQSLDSDYISTEDFISYSIYIEYVNTSNRNKETHVFEGIKELEDLKLLYTKLLTEYNVKI